MPTEGTSRELLEAGPGLHCDLCRAEPVTVLRLGSSLINAGDMNVAAKPEGCCQAVMRK